MSTVSAPCHGGAIVGNADSIMASRCPLNPDRVPGGRWVHAAIVGRWQVNPHHQDQVIVLTPEVGR
jgi:hypothetical protein